jgi:hypothetical protein
VTNHELYQAVVSIANRYKSSDRTLEQYLSSLLIAVRRQKNLDGLPTEKFLELLSNAFTDTVLTFDERWRNPDARSSVSGSGIEACEEMLIGQIVDLREMDEAGILKNELRYFGVKAPRGSHWYNFDPGTFLECGIEGVFGGWDGDESSGRVVVPGQVGVLNSEDQIVGVDPEDISDPVVEISEVAWDQFREFLECGQSYE